MTVGLVQFVHREEGLAKACGDDLGAGLRGRVRVVATQWIGLAIGPDLLLVLGTLVGRNRDAECTEARNRLHTRKRGEFARVPMKCRTR
jgi:hypothetical protein